MSDSPIPPIRPRPIFLSYAREDAPAAKRICDALRGFGVEVWFDMNELRGGDAWDAKIRHQVRTCGLFLPIISATTQSRGEGYFRREWKMAVERMSDMATGIAFLVPIVIDQIPESEALVPDEFRKLHWTYLKGGEPSPEFVMQVKQLLENPRMNKAEPAPGLVSRAAPAAAASTKKLSLGPVIAIVLLLLAPVAVILLRKPAAAPVVPAVPAQPTVAPVAAATPAISDKSVAVLPFTNMSSEKDTAYFADGIQEDILTNLALVKQLRVVSRTSVMQYRDTTKAIPAIGHELGVAYILEGSVQRSGKQVRVTGQLIKASSDEHVWAHSYDGDVTDAFAIQSKLATEIAYALQTEISPEEKAMIEAHPTDNAAAYDLFLKARKIDNDSAPSPTALRERITLLSAAVQLDPKFAEAWGELADVHALMLFNYDDATEERRQLAKDAIAKAVAIAPDNPQVMQAVGTCYYYLDRDYAKALEQYERLRALQPNSAAIPFSIGLIQRRQGHWKEGAANLRKAAEMEPSNIGHWIQYADTVGDMQRWPEASAAADHIAKIAPGVLISHNYKTIFRFFLTGDPQVLRDGDREIPEPARSSPEGLAMRIALALNGGDLDGALKLYTELAGRSTDSGGTAMDYSINYAALLLHKGDKAAARALLKPYPDVLREKLRQEPTNVNYWLELGGMQVLLEQKDESWASISKAVELLPISKDALSGPPAVVMRATWYAWFGEKDKAIDELAYLIRIPNGVLVNDLVVSPQWDPLRGMPKFEALIKDPKNREPIE